MVRVPQPPTPDDAAMEKVPDTKKNTGRHPSCDMSAKDLNEILVKHIKTPKTLDYPDKSLGVSAEKIVKLAAMWHELHARVPSLSWKKNTVRQAFVLVREYYGDKWKLRPEFDSAWVASMTTRFRLQAMHIKKAERKGTIWVTTHFKSWFPKLAASAAASDNNDGDEDDADEEDDTEDEEDVAAAAIDAAPDTAAPNPTAADGSAVAPSALGETADGSADVPFDAETPAAMELEPASPWKGDWIVQWHAEDEEVYRECGKCREAATRVVPGDEGDGGLVRAAFGTGDDEELMFVPDMTNGLWQEKQSNRTCGKHNPPLPGKIAYPTATTETGAVLTMTKRSVNKEPYLVMFEGKQQLLQLRITEAGSDEDAVILMHAIMCRYAAGQLKRVELRSAKTAAVKQKEKEAAKIEAVEAPKEAKEDATKEAKEDAKKGTTEAAHTEAKESTTNAVEQGRTKKEGGDRAARSSTPPGLAASAPSAPATTDGQAVSSGSDAVAMEPAPKTPKKRKVAEMWAMDLTDSEDEDPFEWVV